MADVRLSSLKTATPQKGFDLAAKLARAGAKVAQRGPAVRSNLRTAYEQDAAQLIASSQVIAQHFQTVSAATQYWRAGGAPSV
ncbi:MAG: hexameric tyrosine-coordinated heme protein [Hansschlegelia sp.]